MEEKRIGSVCFTGHRELPDALSAEYRELIRDTDLALKRVYEAGARDFYTGGAAGFDQIAGELVLRLKKKDPSVRLHVLLPYAGYTGKLNHAERLRRQTLLDGADEVRPIFSRYFRGCFLQRDRALVDQAESCIAYLRKAPSGTAWTVSFARQKGIPVVLL